MRKRRPAKPRKSKRLSNLLHFCHPSYRPNPRSTHFSFSSSSQAVSLVLSPHGSNNTTTNATFHPSLHHHHTNNSKCNHQASIHHHINVDVISLWPTKPTMHPHHTQQHLFLLLFCGPTNPTKSKGHICLIVVHVLISALVGLLCLFTIIVHDPTNKHVHRLYLGFFLAWMYKNFSIKVK